MGTYSAWPAHTFFKCTDFDNKDSIHYTRTHTRARACAHVSPNTGTEEPGCGKEGFKEDFKETDRGRMSYIYRERAPGRQRPESPTITLTWCASKYKAHTFHRKYSLKKGCSSVAFQGQSATRVCTIIRWIQSLFKTGHCLWISKLAQDINTQIHTFTC